MQTWQDLGYSPFLERQTPLEEKTPGSLGDTPTNRLSESDFEAQIASIQSEVKLTFKKTSEGLDAYTLNGSTIRRTEYQMTVTPSSAKLLFRPYDSIFVTTDNDPNYRWLNGASLTDTEKNFATHLLEDFANEKYNPGQWRRIAQHRSYNSSGNNINLYCRTIYWYADIFLQEA